mgnify:CR=1 FL=1
MAKAPFESVWLGTATHEEELDLGIRRANWGKPTEKLTPEQWRQQIDLLRDRGVRLVQSEWHHASFVPPEEGPARSGVSFELHAEDADQRYLVTGKLAIVWSSLRDEKGDPQPAIIRCEEIQMLKRPRADRFEKVLTVDGRAQNTPNDTRQTLQPVMLHDLDGDGRTDIALGGSNQVYWNQGQMAFEAGVLCAHPIAQVPDAGLLADLNGDARVDFVTFAPNGLMRILFGEEEGAFTKPSDAVTAVFDNPTVITAGDIDDDGDLDLFVGQYKTVFKGGQMPTPYYDANDGYPAYLLRNRGNGVFEDITEAAGLEEKRHRRTYGASLCDINADRNLDLVVVSDFAGVDIYHGDGEGAFGDVTADVLDDPKVFGMGHSYGDFDGDGRLDLFVTGMSSTTARRLDELGLRHPDFERHNEMRAIMAYGNRMYLRRGNRLRQPEFRDSVARTGWSWGCAAADFDNDGDQDIYVANGHISGDSCKDYCTTFWRHDIYASGSSESVIHAEAFANQLRPLVRGDMSWNGFEHNRLLMNRQGGDFVDIAFLLGIACEYDCRGVVCDDFDQDGRVDLIVVEEQRRNGIVRQRLHLYHNRIRTTGHWFGVRLIRQSNGCSPLGAIVELKSASGQQIRSVVAGDSMFCQSAAVVHFGLGRDNVIEELSVIWPNGKRSQVVGPQVDSYVEVATPTTAEASDAR